MNAYTSIKATGSKVIHADDERFKSFATLCGSTSAKGFEESEGDVTCKRCTKKIEDAARKQAEREAYAKAVDEHRAEIAAEAASIDEAIDRDVEAGTYSYTNEIAILRDAPGRAIVTAAFDRQTVGGSIVRKGKTLVLTAGSVRVTGNTFEKVAKRFAKALGFRVEIIDVARSF